MGMLREPDQQTDELRRLAMQLALQLPASVIDARRVLELTNECLDEFLIDKAAPCSAADRARRLWRGAQPVASDAAAGAVQAAPPVLATVLCCFGVLAIAAVIGGIAIRLVGFGATGANLLAITAIGLLFGRRAALGSVAGAFLLTNWAVIPPVWDLTWPTTYEWSGLVMLTAAAIAVPWIQLRREPLRAASLRVVGDPLRGLLRRAA